MFKPYSYTLIGMYGNKSDLYYILFLSAHISCLFLRSIVGVQTLQSPRNIGALHPCLAIADNEHHIFVTTIVPK